MIESNIKIKDINNKINDAQIILEFNSDITGKDYVVYTFNEKTDNDMLTIYASIKTIKNNEIIFSNITEEEWIIVKNYMKQKMDDKLGDENE